MMSLAQGKNYAPGYNGQLSVDNQSRLIVSQELVQDRNDEKQFSRQYEQVENNLGMDKERKYIADGGYSSLSQTDFVKTNDIDAYIADPKLKNYKEEGIEVIQQEEKKLNRLDFKYKEDNDCYHCPMGESLELIGNNFVGRSYRSKDCSQCSIKRQYLGKNNKSGQRTILRDKREESAEQMRQKMMTPEGISMMMRRQTTIEPVFGNIKENFSYRRFRRKGLINAKREFALFCLVHNINSLYTLVYLSFII
jgi:transposase